MWLEERTMIDHEWCLSVGNALLPVFWMNRYIQQKYASCLPDRKAFRIELHQDTTNRRDCRKPSSEEFLEPSTATKTHTHTQLKLRNFY